VTLLRSAPLPRQSAKAKARAETLNRTKRAVLTRAAYKCELCGAQGVRLDLHHAVGRGNLIGPEWADTPELCLAICRPCHREIENNHAARVAGQLLALRHFWPKWSREPRPGGDPLDLIRGLILELENPTPPPPDMARFEVPFLTPAGPRDG
jgi:hypothetical protein